MSFLLLALDSQVQGAAPPPTPPPPPSQHLGVPLSLQGLLRIRQSRRLSLKKNSNLQSEQCSLRNREGGQRATEVPGCIDRRFWLEGGYIG